MGLKQRILTWLVKAPEFDEKFTRALYNGLMRGGNINQIQDNADDYIEKGYQGNADVYSIIKRYVTMSQQADLELVQKMPNGDIELIEGHELNKFLIEANPNQTMQEFREAYAVYILTLGNSFWYKPILESGVNIGKSLEVYTMPSNDVEVIQNLNNFINPISGYKLENSNVEFTTDEVYHSKYFNPMFYNEPTMFGQSPLMAARNILIKQNEAALTEGKQFENQGPAYLMYRDSPDSWNTMSDPQKVELQKEINGLAAKGKQGSGLVLKDKFGVIKLGISASDLNIIESTQDGRRILCNVYQLPVGLFNDPEGSTYNNISTARKAAWTDALIPHNDTFAIGLTNFIINPVPEYVSKGYFYRMNYSSVEELQEGIKNKVDWMVRAHWSANQILQATGKPTIDDPAMDEPIFSQSELLLSDLNLDTNLEAKNHGDYK